MHSDRAVAAGCVLALILAVAVAIPASAASFRTEVWGPGAHRALINGRITVVPNECAAGQCLVRLSPWVSGQRFADMLARHNGRILKAFPRYRMYLVSLPEGTTVRQGVAIWEAEAGVLDAEPNLLCYPSLVPNDPRYSEQYQWPRVSAPDGWDMTTGSPTVTVAVVDTGTDLDHPDLASRLWVNGDEVPGDGIDNDGNGYVDDINGWDFYDDDNDPQPHPTDPVGEAGANHGTHVAGIIGAATNNGEGVAGHDWNCKLMTCKVFPDDGSASLITTMIAGVQYALDNGADVVNLSVESGYTTAWDPVFQQARQQGVVIVAAAGNDFSEITDDQGTWISPVCNDGPNPATDNWVLGVAATDQNDVKADFSNYDGSSTGSFVDVSAPGVNILSCYIDDPAHGFDKPYDLMSGTSMATPMVSGLAALVLAQYPSLSPADVFEQIKTTTDNIDAQNPGYIGKLGTGRINTPQAIGLDLPPGPPRGVMAVDTPNDEGGSITVSWSKSVDDGRGRNDVREYVVYRCDNAADPDTGADVPAGNWTQKARVPVGEPLVYVDVTVTDKVPYWYRVSAKDASNETLSNPAGPAMSRDDLPPPAVENVRAADNQADDGGAISVSWGPYTAPTDFAGYHVWRGTTNFTQLSQATQIADIPGDVNETFYLDRTTTDGVDYWYAVTAYDDEGNELQTVTAVGPVQSSPNITVSLPAGLLMMCIGAQTRETDMAALLGIDPGDLKLARYDPLQQAYRTYQANPNDTFLQQAPGRAFWLRLDDPLMLNIAGQPVADDPFAVPVSTGWNMVGNPFNHDLRWEGVMVSARGTQWTLPQSNQAGITLDFAWTWDPFTSSYQLVSEYAGFGTKLVRQGYGFWFKANEPCTLLLPAGTTTTAVRAERPGLDVDWKLKLVARCGQTVDSDNYIGVSAQAAVLNGLLTPPRPTPGLELYLVNPGQDGAAAASFVKPGQPLRYQAKVQVAAVGGQEVEITWPDLSSLPPDVRPVLIDEAAGKRVYMRTNRRYTFRPSPGETERALTVVSEPGGDMLRVTSLAARPTGAGVEVVFSLSAPAKVTVEVLNIAGRRVRTIAVGKEAPAGPSSVRWNATSDAGSPVPAGTYLVRVIARTDDGQQSASVGTVRLVR
ncbi:MAG: S8 family serine peptidase [Armatimonadetes bacterium]|nr:S8 family serine peptidase [Armatimonadota bacterium]